MGSDLFKVEITGNIARCSMNSPENMNALNTEMGYPMVEAMGEVLADDSVRVIILRGEGGQFCSGADLDLLGADVDPLFLNQAMKAMGSLIFQLYTGPKPVITEVDGFAVGGGLGLALASDITYATERALFCMGFIRIAAAPDMGSSYFLAERVGLVRAKKMAFTGEVVGAEEALRIGLVNEVVDHQEISDKVMELAQRIARRSPETLAWTKRVMNKYQRLELQSVLDLEAHVQPIMLLSEDHRAAVKKIMDRWMQKDEGD